MSSQRKEDAFRASRFLETIGFVIVLDERADGFLEHARIETGCRLVANLNHHHGVGDLLHEAGHLAVIPSLFRSRVSGDVEETLSPLADEYTRSHTFHVNDSFQEDPIFRGILQAGEQEAQAWSYAAAIHLGIDPLLIFDDEVSMGLSDTLLGLQANCHPGIHGLAAGGMTERRLFPAMKRWVQV